MFSNMVRFFHSGMNYVENWIERLFANSNLLCSAKTKKLEDLRSVHHVFPSFCPVNCHIFTDLLFLYITSHLIYIQPISTEYQSGINL